MSEHTDDATEGAADRQRPDPRVSTVPLETEDGDQVVIQQQNVGPGNQVGAGEFKRSEDTAVQRDPADAAAEQDQLEAEAPIDDERSRR